MRTEDVPETKLRILRAAEELFAEKGFDGARVDDIAGKAGVNKALIYYYFKSKRDILEELFSNLIEELAKMVYGSFENEVFSVDDLINLESGEDMLRMTEVMYNFMEGKRDTIRIMMMESLKASEEKPSLFRFSEIAMGDEADRIKALFKDRGISVDDVDMDEARVADFFTGMMPMIGFMVYRDKWSEYFHIDPDELKRKFLTVFLTTHLAYHKMQLGKLKQ